MCEAVCDMDVAAERTGTKPQEQVLHSAAAQRAKYMDVLCMYLPRAAAQ